MSVVTRTLSRVPQRLSRLRDRRRPARTPRRTAPSRTSFAESMAIGLGCDARRPRRH